MTMISYVIIAHVVNFSTFSCSIRVANTRVIHCFSKKLAPLRQLGINSVILQILNKSCEFYYDDVYIPIKRIFRIFVFGK